MVSLASRHCAPCSGEGARLEASAIANHMKALPEWQLDNQAITRRFTFKNFSEALAFVNRLGQVAEEEGHHPDLTLGWGYVGVTLTTHDCGGLSENDMIMAAKIDALVNKAVA